MELTSIVGPIMGLVAVFGTAMIKGVPLIALWGGSALCIVGLGSLAAVTVGYPLKDFIGAFKALKLFMNGPSADGEEMVNTIERLALLARKDGFLALEKETEKLDDEFLQKGVRMLIDNMDPEVIKETMEAEIEMKYEEEEIAGKFWEDMGAFSPTVGILGAVLGLMVVMQNLQNPEKIGPGIAAAFIATLYGVGLANLFALPCGKKLKRMVGHQKRFREMIMTGVLGMAHGHAPRMLKERLASMIE